MKTALTIAGSDSGGGAGIQADIKTFSSLGVFGMSVITAVTAQNTMEVKSVQMIDSQIISDQISAIFDDIHVDAVKIGMLGTKENIDVVAKELNIYRTEHIILDPVMISKGGHHLLQQNAIEALKEKLLPMVTLITPNIPEAESLTDRKICTIEDMYTACLKLQELGANKILLKGGHLEGDPNDLFFDGHHFTWLPGKRIHTKNVNGTGCTLSSAITAFVAQEETLLSAVKKAKDYITIAIQHSLELGSGHGPTNHFYHLYERAGLVDNK
ncbi:bifunctional hydroxymethylpyrimidine kinase/phosphomethylpyrimidine kinase [Heyndrickxia sporothermodurans]|uniref:bifunctional hydroxymethylpyrimidine kinase/phosphomethylpyrimidine kinase n=1 Tax=Heyndrickxia sporothermodurans TaxID=46224 RepID=UPI00192CA8D4|nr:bifunctional hydroxymethylpyrimidine kinase/phosphomethylpyrimidine kinase [Heyndrickxia sporothermodurans]MBL5795168.1 bifunctional hydroxymethylpyrimidine kinase/phosphomethylpyrimidine kinase [Heyndrickxia sporothermodurans]MBL5831120.1 bifunctional hydroxymethylpyrimidine kinase/phosphomethylpyrimidine kinase [Heyndrickxia sporothermodurans]